MNAVGVLFSSILVNGNKKTLLYLISISLALEQQKFYNDFQLCMTLGVHQALLCS